MSNVRVIATDATGSRETMTRREFAEQYQAIYRRLWLIAVGVVGDRTEADDIVQDAAIIAFRRLDDFRAGSDFSAWVAVIVKQCASNYLRKIVGRRTFATDPQSLDREGMRSAGGGSVDVTEEPADLQTEFGDEMVRVLDQLNSDARVCLLLRIIDGLSYAEISRFVGIPEGTAMSHVHRSKQLMRRQLSSVHSSNKRVDE